MRLVFGVALVLAGVAGMQAQQAGTPAIVQPGAPGQATKTLPAGTTGKIALKPAKADIDFMQGMVMHHGQAVEMTALIEARTQNPEVRALGKKISVSQTDEMGYMKRWLTARGQAPEMPGMGGMAGMDMAGMDHSHMDMSMPMMPGMLTPAQMDALRKSSGAEFDRLFLTGMIQHHTGALVMVKELFDTPGAGQDSELFDFATDVDNTQKAEIRIMQGMLKERQ